MVYIIDSCYASNHKEESIIVKNNNLTIEEMTNIVGALANLYFKTTSEHLCPPCKLQGVLCDTLMCKDKKHKYTGELGFIISRIQSPMLHTTFVLHDELLVWVDVAEAMDYTFARTHTILNEFFNAEEIKKIENEWRTEL